MSADLAFRCAATAAARGDSMIGTAPPQARVLLVHQPGPWGPKGLVESRCDPAVARRIDAAAAKNGMRLQAIRRPGRHEIMAPGDAYQIGIADTAAGRATIAWWLADDLAAMATELETGFPQRQPLTVDSEPLYLICAHGRHDACCALRGRPVAQALVRARPGRVWETTHLGGDRFAANVLVLPTGELYGRVSADDAETFAASADAGNVVPELLRGRIGLVPAAQTALVYAHRQLGSLARDAISVASVARIGAGRSRVVLRSAAGTFAADVLSEMLAPARLTCKGPANARARSHRVISFVAT